MATGRSIVICTENTDAAEEACSWAVNNVYREGMVQHQCDFRGQGPCGRLPRLLLLLSLAPSLFVFFYVDFVFPISPPFLVCCPVIL